VRREEETKRERAREGGRKEQEEREGERGRAGKSPVVSFKTTSSWTKVEVWCRRESSSRSIERQP